MLLLWHSALLRTAKNFALVSFFTLFRSFPPIRYAVGPSYLAF